MLEKINIIDLSENFVKLLSSDWALISAGVKEDCNAMTISWGGIGYLWNKNVVYCFIRPQRHTLKYLKDDNNFSVTFYDNQYKDQLKYLGTVSGNNEDKMHTITLTPFDIDDTVSFTQARLTMIIKPLYKETIKENNFLVTNLSKTFYPKKDYHFMIIGEIVNVYINKD